MEDRLQKLKIFLQKEYPNIQAFNCISYSDDTDVVYSDGNIQVRYCKKWHYVEILGLDENDFDDLLDKNSFLGDNLKTFNIKEL